jgi:hypothetical protein
MRQHLTQCLKTREYSALQSFVFSWLSLTSHPNSLCFWCFARCCSPVLTNGKSRYISNHMGRVQCSLFTLSPIKGQMCTALLFFRDFRQCGYLSMPLLNPQSLFSLYLSWSPLSWKEFPQATVFLFYLFIYFFLLTQWILFFFSFFFYYSYVHTRLG